MGGDEVAGVVDRALAGRPLLARRLAVAIRALLVAGILAIPVPLVNVRVWDWIHLILLGGFAVGTDAAIVLAATLRCPSSSRRFLMESMGSWHPAARRERHLDVWSTMVWAVTGRREFTRMYCGRAWDLP